MIFRKMVQNKWLEISLLLGLVITVALVSSMPIYTEAILSRMLVKDLEKQQQTSHIYSGSYSAFMVLTGIKNDQVRNIIKQSDSFMNNQAALGFKLPIKELVTSLATARFEIASEASSSTDLKESIRGISVASSIGLEKHIKLIDGRMPGAQPVDGVYEVLVTNNMLIKLKTVLNNVFTIQDKLITEKIKLKPVGVFESKIKDDLFFSTASMDRYSSSFIMNEQLYNQEFVQKAKLSIDSVEYYFVMDYSKMRLGNVKDFLLTNNLIKKWVDGHSNGTSFETVPAQGTFKSYESRAANLRILIWSLNVPVIIMLAFYMFMVANMIMERQKNEIAVLRSRGAARWKIMLIYLIECLLLAIVAYPVGILLGLLLIKMIGASNGFLEFVQRSAMPVHINREALQYGLIALSISLIMMLIPAFLATRVTIVGLKQRLARQNIKSVWHKLFLDMIALGIAIYGLHMFRVRMNTLLDFGLSTTDLKIDSLQFIVPALFILGSGLFLLRLYPYLLQLIYWVGRKWWPPSIYATLIQVGRSSSQYQFLMIFLIMTIATGVFSASAARTINNNTEDRVSYGIGADVVLQMQWPNDAPPAATLADIIKATFEKTGLAEPPERIHYTEPPIEPVITLPGVEQYAKVFKKPNIGVSAKEVNSNATLMAINTFDFGRTAWFRDGLLSHSFYEYLNLIASNPKAVLISQTMADELKVKVGDLIDLGWSGVEDRSFTVYGIIKYFPTFNPNQTGTGSEPAPMLVVANLRYVQANLATEPYQIWMKLKPGATMNEFYQGMKDRKLKAILIQDTKAELITSKNDPFLLSINGVLSLGFMISLGISFIGFLLYWMLALRGRTLQYGILRAVGISFRSLIFMLAAEQILTSVAAIAIGLLIGNVTSRLYVPVFQSAFDVKKLVPPFQVMFDSMDTMRLYMVVSVMLVLGLCILGWMLSRIKMHQALKLGED
ncbi:ABC transporter permease [Paenibacillus psychroresistens]|uniref:ABC transporter permease n=2 Tax=Paenibacillus psychroresistens TaxID=1778678 RepID=A0A6B8RUH2_9BACL|nr:ABC transporter permease [Paenibacillus psychroresistens]